MQSYVISENNALLSELCAGARNVASDVTAVVFGDGAAAAGVSRPHSYMSIRRIRFSGRFCKSYRKKRF